MAAYPHLSESPVVTGYSKLLGTLSTWWASVAIHSPAIRHDDPPVCAPTSGAARYVRTRQRWQENPRNLPEAGCTARWPRLFGAFTVRRSPQDQAGLPIHRGRWTTVGLYRACANCYTCQSPAYPYGLCADGVSYRRGIIHSSTFIHSQV